MFREKKSYFLNVSLYTRTVTQRIEEMSENLKSSQEDYFEKLQFFSIAIDESTDTTDTAQLAVFVREIKENFYILGRICGTDSYEKYYFQSQYSEGITSMPCNQESRFLLSITNDGTPSMVGKNKGVVSLLRKHMENNETNNNIAKLQCLIHQEALCAKVASLKNIMDVVLKTVNFILLQGLNHCQFQQLLLEAESQYGDLLYFCNVRWLSRGDMLQRVYRLREIITFLEQKNINAAEFHDQK